MLRKTDETEGKIENNIVSGIDVVSNVDASLEAPNLLQPVIESVIATSNPLVESEIPSIFEKCQSWEKSLRERLARHGITAHVTIAAGIAEVEERIKQFRKEFSDEKREKLSDLELTRSIYNTIVSTVVSHLREGKLTKIIHEIQLSALEYKLQNDLDDEEVYTIENLTEEINNLKKELKPIDGTPKKLKRQSEIKNKLKSLDELAGLNDKVNLFRKSLRTPSLQELKQKLEDGINKEAELDSIEDVLAEIESKTKELQSLEQNEKKPKPKHQQLLRERLSILNPLKTLHEKIKMLSPESEKVISSPATVVMQEIKVPVSVVVETVKLPNKTSSNKFKLRQDQLISKLKALDSVPLSAEKIASQLHVYAQLMSDGLDSIEINHKIIPLDRGNLKSCLDDLEARLRKEGLYSFIIDSRVKEALKSLEISLSDPMLSPWKDLQSKMKSILEIIEPFSLIDLRYLIAQGETASNSITNNDDIVLFIGSTGTGKSTTIHFLAGSKFHKEVGKNYFEPYDVKVPELERIVTGEDVANSQTRFITIVPINCANLGPSSNKEILTGKMILCDAPGFGDSGGTEVDVANSINIFNAIQKCRSVKLLMLLSQRSMGDRGDGLRELVHLICNMRVSQKKEPTMFYDKIHFLITRYSIK